MIKIQTLDRIENVEHIVKPTIFPDGTSQVWKLPEEVIESKNTKITWNFESEVELMYLASLKTLLSGHVHLHIPYLPYARQDKEINNNSTFNLYTFAKLLNALDFNLVTAVDVHNSSMTDDRGNNHFPIKNFKNIEVNNIIEKLFEFNKIDAIVYPDKGSHSRYSINKCTNSFIICDKKRDQSTGEITGHKILDNTCNLKEVKMVLIVDDICDGGATFISIAKLLREINPELFIMLYVTHGIFSKGTEILFKDGINNTRTTNSLLKNMDGFKV